MYIPTANFSSQGSCVTASVSYVSGNGSITSGSFVSQSITWSYIQFANTANLTSNSSSFTASLNVLQGYSSQVKLLVVGAGGSGGLGSSNACPSSLAATAAGGGGGGGTVYIDTFALYSGSFEICVGAGGGTSTNRNGSNSYIKLPNGADYPIYGNQIAAGGGGAGGRVTQACPPAISGIPLTNAAASAGSSGGGASRPNPFAIQTGGSGGNIGSLYGDSQGYKGGDCLNDPINNQQFEVQGAGGGGSAAAASNADFTPTSNTYITNGGAGKTFSITGTSLTYGGGGGGTVLRGFPNTFYYGTNGSCTSGYGAGGRGGVSYSGNPETQATSGVVIIAWPFCTASVIPPSPVTTKPNILSGSILTAWQWAPSYTASATTWSDSNIYNNTAQFRSGNTNPAVSMSVSSSSIVFNNNKMVYNTFPMTATPSSSFSLNVFGEFNSGSTYYPLFANANSIDNGWDFTLIRSGSTPYISYKTTYSPGPGQSTFLTIDTSLLDTNIFTGSNQLTINVNTNSTTKTGSIDVYLNGTLNASSISASYIRTFTDGSGNNQFGISYSNSTSYITLNNAKIKDTMIYNRVLTQAEILSNYNALTASLL